MKKNRLIIPAFIIGLIVWIALLIKQQINITQYKNEMKSLSAKLEVADEELNQNKKKLEEEKQNTKKLEYIEKLAREKLGMYLPNERVYIDSNM